MNKKLKELLAKIEDTKVQAKTALEAGDIMQAETLRDEIKDLQKQFDIAKDLYEEEKQAIIENHVDPKEQVNSVKEFANAVRNKFQNAMKVGTEADGGYTVPSDIRTQINELREDKGALQNLITVEKVSAPTGSRVFKTRAQQEGFAEVTEEGNILEKSTPQFTQLKYAVKKYAGFFKTTNELLKDSDASITNALVRWIGDESRVTRNKLILAALNTKAKTAITSVDDIKKAHTVQLDPAFHSTAKIVTNQDGFNWLDTQKDLNGQYLLQPSVSSPTGKKLGSMDVVMVSNLDLPNDTTAGTKAPIIIGDLNEGVVMFDLEDLTIASSTDAGTAFTTDVTLFRAIEREEVKVRDEAAFVYGQVVIE